MYNKIALTSKIFKISLERARHFKLYFYTNWNQGEKKEGKETISKKQKKTKKIQENAVGKKGEWKQETNDNDDFR